MNAQLKIDARAAGEGTAVLALVGEVDVATAAQVRQAALKLISDGTRRLIIDLSGTEYLDSSGLGTLVGLLKRIREAGGEMPIAGAQPRVERVFEITGLTQVFRLYDDVDKALEEVGR
jgi:anti-sigma B factor antagonist